jgi:hypothetical protein
MEETADTDRIRRLRAARATGHVPSDLIPWLVGLATASEARDQPATVMIPPGERLLLAVSMLVDQWITLRGVSGRTLGCSRRTLSRALTAENITIASLADLADALDCEVAIEFRPRDGPYLAPFRPQVAPALAGGSGNPQDGSEEETA